MLIVFEYWTAAARIGILNILAHLIWHKWIAYRDTHLVKVLLALHASLRVVYATDAATNSVPIN